MGDYKIEHNTLADGLNGVPNMHAGVSSMRISNKELLGDITGSTAFSLRDFTLNPGSSETFPWLSRIAQNFSQYKFHGLSFVFNSTSASALNSVNTAMGTVLMATQYNVALPNFLNKAEMMQYEFSTSTIPSRGCAHLIECAPSKQVMDELFTRFGALSNGVDYQFYDWGRFQLATAGMQAAATIGELWVCYDVEFSKPRIGSGGVWPGQFTRISNGVFSQATNPLGDIQTTPVGNLGVTVAAGATGWQRIFFPVEIAAGRFIVTTSWRGAAANIVHPTRTYSNVTTTPVFGLGTLGETIGPNGGTQNSGTLVMQEMITINGYSSTGSYIEFGVAGTLPATPISVDIYVEALPLSDTAF